MTETAETFDEFESTAIFADAPHPNAARVFQNFLYTAKTQQLAVDAGGTRSVHPDVKDPPGRTPLSEIKMLPDDPMPLANIGASYVQEGKAREAIEWADKALAIDPDSTIAGIARTSRAATRPRDWRRATSISMSTG